MDTQTLLERAKPNDGRQNNLRVFVLGNARSGASIVSLAINKFFKLPVTSPHVMPLFKRIVSVYDNYELLKHPHVLANRLRPRHVRDRLGDMAREFYAEQVPDGSWQDKTPGALAIQSAPLIEDFFPDARLIVMKRNGVEVVESYRKKFSSDFDRACNAWARGMEALSDVKDGLKNAIIVDQYDLTNNVEETSRLVCQHLHKAESAEAMAKFFQTTSRDKLSTHERTRRLTLADMAWAPDETKLFIKTCGKWMEAWGYPM